MRLRTASGLGRRGRLRLLLAATRLATPFYRLVWLAAAVRAGVLRTLADGARSVDAAFQHRGRRRGRGQSRKAPLGKSLGHPEATPVFLARYFLPSTNAPPPKVMHHRRAPIRSSTWTGSGFVTR